MARQLSLLEITPVWRIDEATREVGRRGLADARASLRAAMAAQDRSDAVIDREHPAHGRSAA